MKRMLKNKGFLIDKISEDSFYENLLLGLPTLLKNMLFVSQIKLERFKPATYEDVLNWEQANQFVLPLDLRNFYMSSNGFSFTYKFQYDKKESDRITHVMGGIEIESLQNLEKIDPSETSFYTQTGVRIVVPNKKIYVLTKIDEDAHVVLVQFNQPLKPATFWLCYKMKHFYFLCGNFVTYMRMALAHLGIPGWQFFILKASLPEWSEEIMQILAPGIFYNQPCENNNDYNVIDNDIFKMSVNDSEFTFTDNGEEVKVNKGVGGVSEKKKSGKNKHKK